MCDLLTLNMHSLNEMSMLFGQSFDSVKTV